MCPHNRIIRIPESSELKERDTKENTRKIQGEIQENKLEADICFENVTVYFLFLFFSVKIQ